jgi:hypothetical protein
VGGRVLPHNPNTLDRNHGTAAVAIEDAEGVLIADNRFIPTDRPLPKGTRACLDFKSTRNINLRGNVIEDSPPGDLAVTLGKEVTGITGNDPSGITLKAGSRSGKETLP